MLGAVIFGEKLPVGWWVGAGLLAAGNVVIGRREEGEKPGGTVGLDETREEAEALLVDSRVEGHSRGDLVELEDEVELGLKGSPEEQRRLRTGEDVDAPL